MNYASAYGQEQPQIFRHPCHVRSVYFSKQVVLSIDRPNERQKITNK